VYVLPHIWVIPRISLTVENVYVVYRGQTALLVINASEAFLRSQLTAVKAWWFGEAAVWLPEICGRVDREWQGMSGVIRRRGVKFAKPTCLIGFRQFTEAYRAHRKDGSDTRQTRMEGRAEISVTTRRTVVRGLIPGRMRTLVCMLRSRLLSTPPCIPCW
jgi:hypothetical protein